MHKVTVRVRDTEQLARWKEAAAREGLELREWLLAAAELAIARGSTR